MKRKVKQLWDKRPRRKKLEPSFEEAVANIPRITNETVAEHRENILSGARKLIYPLKHSTHRVFIISISILAALVVGFFVYCVMALYWFNTSSEFMYRVTRVLPFPVAKAGPDFVSYEDYLFELRHYIHYYQTQQEVDFDSEAGGEQLESFRQAALQSVTDNAYIKQLARDNGVEVTDADIQSEIQLLRTQNRLGGSNQVFENVLKEYWDWSIGDFERKLHEQLLAQKVVSKLDTQANKRAQKVLNALKNGGDFAKLAEQNSDDDRTKSNGGDYGFVIERTNRDLSPQVIDALFKLKPDQTSGIIDTPIGLEIVRVREKSSSGVRASHIFIAFKSINDYIDPLKADNPPRYFIDSPQQPSGTD